MTSFSNHPALEGLDSEQLAELALYGLRYRALGAVQVDFSKPDRLDVYWTGERMAKKAVKDALKATKAGNPLAGHHSGVAAGHLQALFNCSVIDNATYMAQYHLLLGRHKTKVS
jgi:type VI protein secretion system component VasA